MDDSDDFSPPEDSLSPEPRPGKEDGDPARPSGTGRRSGAAARWVPPTAEELAALLPQYQIECLIGQGGMGAVYKGIQPNLDRPVAVKLLSEELSTDEQFVKRFQREARTLGKLHHPGIVAVYDFGRTSQGHLYFVMEYVDGTDLRHILKGPGLDPDQALELIDQICAALQAAHKQGVIHRDIKPENLLITRDGEAKLADFGLARPMQEDTGGLTMTNMVMGTPDYMSPEQRIGYSDERTDIYALGVMLYEMLTGRTPRGAFVPPSQKVQVDVRIDKVVIKALREEMELRYQQVSELRTDVDHIRTTVAPGTEPGSTEAAIPDPLQRSTIFIIVVAIAAAVLGAGGFYFFMGRNIRSADQSSAISRPASTVPAQSQPPPPTPFPSVTAPSAATTERGAIDSPLPSPTAAPSEQTSLANASSIPQSPAKSGTENANFNLPQSPASGTDAAGGTMGIASTISNTTTSPAPAPDLMAWVLEKKERWPKNVTLTRPVSLNVLPSGSIMAPAGTTVKVINIQPDQVTIEWLGSRQVVPCNSTDLIKRIPAEVSRVASMNLAAASSEQPHENTPGMKLVTTPKVKFLQENLQRSLVLYYDFDAPPVVGNIPDKSGHGNNGKVVGVEWVADDHRGGVMKFGLTNSYIMVPNNETLNPPELTEAAWIKTSYTDVVWRRIFDKCWDNGYDLTMGGDHLGKSYMGQVFMEVGKKDAGQTYANSGVSVADGQWHHVVGTFDANTARIYVDGEPVGHVRTWKAEVPHNSYNLTIGTDRSNPNPAKGEVGASFNGMMDDVMLFNRALSSVEVKALFDSTNPVASTGSTSPIEKQAGEQTTVNPQATTTETANLPPLAPAVPATANASPAQSNNPDSQSATVEGSSSGDTGDPSIHKDWKLVWEDDFSKDNGQIDRNKWNFEIDGKGGGNDELEYYTDNPKNARIENGRLVITAIKDDGGHSFTSARMNTKGKYSWLYGRIEASIKATKGKGYDTSFWMMPEEAVYGGWARSGEIDISEILGRSTDTSHGSLVYGDQWPKNVSATRQYTLPSGDFSQTFHLFSLEWEKGVMRWYIDNKLYQTRTDWNTAAAPFPAPFDQKFHIILNLSVGGHWPGTPDKNTADPQSMEVEYVRVYQPQ